MLCVLQGQFKLRETYFVMNLLRMNRETTLHLSLCQLLRSEPLYDFKYQFIFNGERLLATRPTSEVEDHPLSIVRGCLFNIFAAALHSWRPFLHLQPEDAPCCEDRDPPNIRMYLGEVGWGDVDWIGLDQDRNWW
jgi:hypothetical protein